MPTPNPTFQFRRDFNQKNSPADITITDLVAAGYGQFSITPSQVRIKVTAYGPDGSMFYQDASPVINGNTSVWAVTLTNCPVDTKNKFLLGTYLFTLLISIDGGSTYAYTHSLTYEFDYISPVISCSIEADIIASTARSTDLTVYGITNQTDHGPETIQPYTFSRAHTGYWPDQLELTPITVSTAILTFGPNIYSKVYQSKIVSDLIYEMITSEVFIIDQIKGGTSLTVKYNKCLCLFFSCMNAIEAKYESVLGVDLGEAERLRTLLDRVNDYFRLYLSAVMCGEDPTGYCTKINDIVKAEDPCDDCGFDDDEYPVEIIPLAQLVGGGNAVPGNKITMGPGASGTPVAGMISGDIHIFTTTGSIFIKGDIYKYTSSWAYAMNIMGDQGNPGASPDPTDNPMEVLYESHDEVSTSAGTSEEDLAVIGITFSQFRNINDYMRILFEAELAENDRGKRMVVEFDGNTLFEYFTDELISEDSNRVLFEIELDITDTAKQDLIVTVKHSGLPGIMLGPKKTQLTLDLSTEKELKLIGENSEAYAEEITCDHVKQEIYYPLVLV